MSADTLGVHIHYMAVGWHTCSDKAYMLADTLGACILYLGQYAIFSLKIYLAEIGLYAICALWHYEIHL